MKKNLVLFFSVLAFILSILSIGITEYEYEKAVEYTSSIRAELLKEELESQKTILDILKRQQENLQMLCSAGIKQACEKQ